MTRQARPGGDRSSQIARAHAERCRRTGTHSLGGRHPFGRSQPSRVQASCTLSAPRGSLSQEPARRSTPPAASLPRAARHVIRARRRSRHRPGLEVRAPAAAGAGAAGGAARAGAGCGLREAAWAGSAGTGAWRLFSVGPGAAAPSFQGDPSRPLRGNGPGSCRGGRPHGSFPGRPGRGAGEEGVFPGAGCRQPAHPMWVLRRQGCSASSWSWSRPVTAATTDRTERSLCVAVLRAVCVSFSPLATQIRSVVLYPFSRRGNRGMEFDQRAQMRTDGMHWRI